MLLHGINNNILIPHMYYLGLYQDEAKMIFLQIYKYIFWVWYQIQKNEKMVVHVSLSTLRFRIYIYPTEFLNGCWV